jgi:predicted nucleic acid-binding protein
VNLVLDNSVAMLWLLPGSNPAGLPIAEAVLAALEADSALVPSLWALEVANVVAKVESRGIVTVAQSQRFLALLGRLNIATDQATAVQALGETLNLARRHRLSAYDAAYLELALRAHCPLATLDAALERAARAAGVDIFGLS